GSGPSRYMAVTGHRLVAFSLSLSQPRDDLGPFASGNTAATATVTTATDAKVPVNLSSIDQQIYDAPQGSTMGTGTGTFIVSVPTSNHSVNLVITEGSYSQSFSLWTLRRTGPFPSVLYRSPTTPTVSVTSLGGATISITNPADGFASPAAVTVERAVLTGFLPDGSNATPPSSDEAYFAVTFRSTYPATGIGDPNWGHFLAGITPLPGSALSFAAPGRPPVTATAVNVTAPSDQDTSSEDDGLLDATYVFTVPATTTSGTLAIAPGPATGVEYTGFVGGTPIPLEVGGPTTYPITFQDPHPAPVLSQPKPQWVGAPLPATAPDAASTIRGLASKVPPHSGGGLTIWLAVIILAVLVVAAVVLGRALRRRRASGQASPKDALPTSGEPSAGKTATSAIDDDVESVDIKKVAAVAPAQGNSRVTLGGDPQPATPPVLPTVDGQLVVSVLGPLHITDWDDAQYRPITKELCCYLAVHNDHPLSTDQLLLAVWPVESDRPEATRKTLHNYLSRLRQAVGPEHLPDAASVGGYQVVRVTTDWQQFQDLDRQAKAADTAGGGNGTAADANTVANRLRAEALSLVRGIPFQGVPSGHYRWVFAESWATDMTAAIVDCAHHLFSDLMGSGDVTGALAAARAGLRASPKEELLWIDIANVTIATEDGDHIRRLWQDVAGALGQDAADRIQHRVGA
ncbi:MAG TPA: hypothetical protein VG298_15865, partial [Acidimicrobiales bacterium]|nr:hypothetical protein [Acidimicrobiales bacterium]